MLKRLGLAGLLFATLAVTPLTISARDRNDASYQNGSRNRNTATYTESRYIAGRGAWNSEQDGREMRGENRHRFAGRDDDSYPSRGDSHRNRYDDYR